MSYSAEKMRELFDKRKYNIGDYVYHYMLNSEVIHCDYITGIDLAFSNELGVSYSLGYWEHTTTEESISPTFEEAQVKYESFIANLTPLQKELREKALDEDRS